MGFKSFDRHHNAEHDRIAAALLAQDVRDPNSEASGVLSATFARKDGLVLNIRDFGGRGDRMVYSDASIAAGSNQLSSVSAAFTGADAGKLVVIAGAGTAGDNLAATIVSVSNGVATISASAATAVTAGTVSVGTNNNAAIASVLAAVPASGATIFFPRGGYMYSTQVTPPDNTVWWGEGKGITVLYPCGTTHGFYRIPSATPTPTPTNPPTRIMWIDLTVDGALATGQMKGWYLNHMKKCRWVRTECLNTGASGYGVDYLQDCSFLDAYVENAGRAGTISSPGFSGFGIGTGAFPVENVYFVDCVAKGNKRFGLFLENQDTATQSTGAQIIGGRYTGNQWGISDNGSDSLIVNGAHIVDNIADGFIVTTTAAIEQVGVRGVVQNCIITGNGGDGAQFDYTQNDLITYGMYRVLDNLIEGNGGYGIRTRAAAGRDIPQIVLSGNEVKRNGWAGISIAGGNLINSKMSNNRCFDNGATGQPRGIHINSNLVDTIIKDNICTDTRAAGSKTQAHGLFLETTATITGGSISGNDLRGNSVAATANMGGVAVTCRVRDNDGYNPIGADALTVGASPYTYTVGGTRETLYIIGGTFSSITINGVTVYNSGAVTGTLVLPVDTAAVVVFTYSVVPTAIKRWRH